MRVLRFVCCALILAALPARADTPFALTTLHPLSLAGHTVTLRADGSLVIDATTHQLVPPAYKARVVHESYELAGTTLTLIAEFEMPGTRHDKPVWDLAGSIVAKIDLAANKIVWRSRLSNFERDPTWNLVATPDRLFVRDRHGVLAIDRATGTDAWRLDNDYLRSILVPQIYDTMKLVGDTLAVTGHHWDGEQRVGFAIELEAATGLRVYKTLRYVTPAATPIYVRPDYFLEYPSDRAPPVQPGDWEGLRIGYGYLVWNKTTGEGIVVNPTRNDARTIIEIAKRQRYSDKGKSTPVHWLAVYATQVAIKRSALEPEHVVLPRHKRVAGDPNLIKLEYEGEIVDSGELVDPAAVAAALGANVKDRDLEKPLATKAGAVIAYYEEDLNCFGGCPAAKLSVHLTWGPYSFFDKHWDSYRQGPL